MITSLFSSYLYCFHRVNPKVLLYISYPVDFTPGVVVFVFDLQVIFDEKKLRSSYEVSDTDGPDGSSPVDQRAVDENEAGGLSG
ncbi:hypothetical protein Tco_0329767, partial [Tanacetum coccineum]